LRSSKFFLNENRRRADHSARQLWNRKRITTGESFELDPRRARAYFFFL
jgi:hypothetical protein